MGPDGSCKFDAGSDYALPAVVVAAIALASAAFVRQKRRRARVRHHVLIKLKPETPDAAIATIMRELDKMAKKIPTVVNFEVGRQLASVDDGRNVSLGGIVDFASEDDYKAYAKDPVHLGVLKEFVIPHLAPGGRTALQTAL
mmetsp:Transcript_6762/g.19954  ORF Transcript_6762/g.19954 Transcript_6762/m.19954 type:complete len:142 (+) Transcript_6762:120-545(+)